MPRTLHLLLATFLAAAATSGQAYSFAPFEVTGRLGVSEPHSCDGGEAGDLTTNATITWARCHELKRHMDASAPDWRPVTSDTFEPSAVRPLSLTIEVEAWCSYGGGSFTDGAAAVRVRTQTDEKGYFRLHVPSADCLSASEKPDAVVVRTTALMQYDVVGGSGYIGTIRGLFDRSRFDLVYRSVLPPEPSQYTDTYGDFVIPRFILQQQTTSLPPPATLDIGNQIFFDGASPDYYDYLRAAFGTWQNVVTLHAMLRAALAVDGHDALYSRIFVTYPWIACSTCYTVTFNRSSPGGTGGEGGFIIGRPEPSPTPDWVYGSMVSIGLPAHEFGHSMHATIARGSFGDTDDSMQASMTPSGDIGAGHMYYAGGDTLQQQEMMQAWVEGFGDAMGAYFLNGCSIPDRGSESPDPSVNMFNPARFAWCDAVDPLCPYAHFRFQMSRRGIAEGSATWNARMASLAELADTTSATGAITVHSNNELKVRNLICDLLDTDSDVSYAAGRIAGRSYLPDFTWHAAERMDGRAPPAKLATYASDPGPETVTLSLGTLLEAVDGAMPITRAYGLPYPPPLWTYPTLTDGANGPYDDARLSIYGYFAPQRLADYLIARGAVSRADMNNILRANRMEELP